ncbi:hypothetical protein BT63DRAFT_240815 [Microthyrium microscopicum]|uniref:Uncharacterized protein n=1 Tax=Microthyrium microscopicum TaxID=703497 RepID=A0A6A6UGI0_9PEZI|nr:hypothetical protein BT63DRAFT_240815 [Microthyrium microscopicum]
MQEYLTVTMFGLSWSLSSFSTVLVTCGFGHTHLRRKTCLFNRWLVIRTMASLLCNIRLEGFEGKTTKCGMLIHWNQCVHWLK